MRTFFLDVASHQGLLACVTEKDIRASRPIDHRLTDRALIPVVEDIVKEAEWTMDDLTHIACITGPGGFTSIRVGISAANALAWAKDLPIAGIHLSDLYAARCHEKDFLWLHSTRRTQMFLRGFGTFAKDWPDTVLLSVEELGTLPKASFIGELLPEHETAATTRGLRRGEVIPIETILPDFLAKQSYGKPPLTPWYGRGI